MSEETITSEVVAASLGGAISAGILYPLEVLKTKMQADDDDANNKSMIPYAIKLYNNNGGIKIFFHGWETSSFQSALEKALYFFAYTALKEIHSLVSGGAKLGGLSNLIVGYASEWAHLPISLPVDAWTTKIQTSTNNDERPMKILLNMLGDKNCNFYKGISAYYLLCFKPALQYTVYEQVKQIVLQNRKQQKSLSSIEAFILGMIARTVATVLVFPFLRAKVLMQTSATKSSNNTNNNNNESSSSSNNSNDGTIKILFQQWQRAGIGGLYQGIGPELTRGIFSAALMLMIKERIAEIVRVFLAPRKNNTITALQQKQQLRR